MNSFIYYNPVRVFFGRNAIEKIEDDLMGEGSVLVLSAGRSFEESGARAAVMKKLAGREIAEFSGIRPNPHLDQLRDAVKLARELGAVFILACGGGSVIDAAKFIAAAAVYEGADPWDLVVGRAKIRAALPLGAVLTLPGTGSEHNDGADIDALRVKRICVEKGTVLKRFQARAKGRGMRILKPTCHVFVTVGD